MVLIPRVKNSSNDARGRSRADDHTYPVITGEDLRGEGERSPQYEGRGEGRQRRKEEERIGGGQAGHGRSPHTWDIVSADRGGGRGGRERRRVERVEKQREKREWKRDEEPRAQQEREGENRIEHKRKKEEQEETQKRPVETKGKTREGK
uniref:Uncharacterized protein n=1 Tax=Knipowitschia caucasica TaxID=637954 RepID=A0AAV2JE19_KNICA